MTDDYFFVFCFLFRFLFYKESAPYKQYEALVEQFKKEMGSQTHTDASGEKYEPEMALEDDERVLKTKDDVETEVFCNKSYLKTNANNFSFVYRI